MVLNSSRKAKYSILVAMLFALMALGFNHLLRPLLYLYFVHPPAESFLLMEAAGLVLGMASALLFSIGGVRVLRIGVRSILTVLGTILGLYIVIFGMVTPLPAAGSNSPYGVAFLILAIIALDSWLCLGFLAAVEMIRKRSVGEA